MSLVQVAEFSGKIKMEVNDPTASILRALAGYTVGSFTILFGVRKNLRLLNL